MCTLHFYNTIRFSLIECQKRYISAKIVRDSYSIFVTIEIFLNNEACSDTQHVIYRWKEQHLLNNSRYFSLQKELCHITFIALDLYTV